MHILPYWRDDLTNEEYHSMRNFYSSSTLKLAVEESPLTFKASIDGLLPKIENIDLKLGTIIHAAVLESDTFREKFIMKPDFSEYGHANSKAHREAKAKWKEENAGKLVVTEEDLQMIEGINESLQKHPDAMDLLKGNSFERSGFYQDHETRLPLRIRYDAYDKRQRILTDLKSVRSVKKWDFSKAILDYRWDFSLAMYGEGIKAIDGKGPDDFVYLAVEKKPPYHVAVYVVSARAMEIGRDDYRLALDTVKRCMDSAVWPPYQSEHEVIDLPTYFNGRRTHVR